MYKSGTNASVEPLESRVHLSVAPYNIGDPMPAPQRYVVDVTDRLNLRSQLAGSSIGNTLAALNSASSSFAADFDNALLNYMRGRTAPTYDFAPSDVDAIVNFIKNSSDPDQQKLYSAEVLGTTPGPLGAAPVKPVADKATYRETLRRKGVQYEVMNFLVGGTVYPNFAPVHKQADPNLYVDWVNPLRRSARSTRSRCLCIFSGCSTSSRRQPHIASPATATSPRPSRRRFTRGRGRRRRCRTRRCWRSTGPRPTRPYTATIPTGVRVLPAWVRSIPACAFIKLLTTYHLMLGTPAWTPELNTLFMTLMFQHGRVLGETAKAVYADETSRFGVNANPLGRTDNNKSLQLSGALLTMARMFPEFAATRDAGARREMGWRRCQAAAQGRRAAELSRAIQSYPRNGGTTWKFDGFHKEQSPGYAQGMAEHVCQQLKLSQINGGANDPFLRERSGAARTAQRRVRHPDANGVRRSRRRHPRRDAR